MSAEYTCPGCEQTGLYELCPHTPRAWALAEAFRDAVDRRFPDTDPAWKDDPIAGAWGFINDGELAEGPEFGDPPYRVEMIAYNAGRWTALALIDGVHLVGIPHEEGDASAQYLAHINEDLPIVQQRPGGGANP